MSFLPDDDILDRVRVPEEHDRQSVFTRFSAQMVELEGLLYRLAEDYIEADGRTLREVVDAWRDQGKTWTKGDDALAAVAWAMITYSQRPSEGLQDLHLRKELRRFDNLVHELKHGTWRERVAAFVALRKLGSTLGGQIKERLETQMDFSAALREHVTGIEATVRYSGLVDVANGHHWLPDKAQLFAAIGHEFHTVDNTQYFPLAVDEVEGVYAQTFLTSLHGGVLKALRSAERLRDELMMSALTGLASDVQTVEQLKRVDLAVWEQAIRDVRNGRGVEDWQEAWSVKRQADRAFYAAVQERLDGHPVLYQSLALRLQDSLKGIDGVERLSVAGVNDDTSFGHFIADVYERVRLFTGRSGFPLLHIQAPRTRGFPEGIYSVQTRGNYLRLIHLDGETEGDVRFRRDQQGDLQRIIQEDAGIAVLDEEGLHSYLGVSEHPFVDFARMVDKYHPQLEEEAAVVDLFNERMIERFS